MSGIKTIFWDVGGVLLSNAWDHTERNSALANFGLNATDFEARHEMVVSSFERGKISLDQYLERTVFYQPHPFTMQAFKDYMFTLSSPKPDILQIAQALKRSCDLDMATLNNESRELNQYRIQKFGLIDIFDFFVSSCYVGLRKPEDGIYKLALDLAQEPPEACCFIDDRPINLETAARLGINTIRMVNAAQLKEDLQKLGVMVA
ncbi:MAG TPA: HAD family phosphatase [Terriglobales bacterium]